MHRPSLNHQGQRKPPAIEQQTGRAQRTGLDRVSSAVLCRPRLLEGAEDLVGPLDHARAVCGLRLRLGLGDRLVVGLARGFASAGCRRARRTDFLRRKRSRPKELKDVDRAERTGVSTLAATFANRYGTYSSSAITALSLRFATFFGGTAEQILPSESVKHPERWKRTSESDVPGRRSKASATRLPRPFVASVTSAGGLR
jgi:hypothetical protein